MKRLEVLLLPLDELFSPWCDDVIAAIADRHTLRVFRHNEPLAAQFAGVDVVIDHGGSVGTRQMMDAGANARLWQILGTGFDHFDLDYIRSLGVPVSNCPGQFSATALAESAMMFMLMLAGRFHERQANFGRGTLYGPIGAELGGAHLGIVGFGASGQELARRATAFDMQISAIDVQSFDADLLTSLGVSCLGPPEDLDRLVSCCDYLSLHLHLNDQTRHTLDARRLGLMRDTACVINVARGALIDEAALYDALAAGRIGGAGLDVFAREPPDHTLPVYQLPNVVTTPHTAGTTYLTSSKRAACAAENVDRIASGLMPRYRIDQ
jgi:phosphoglycerate dehydrogenase-like enzyme